VLEQSAVEILIEGLKYLSSQRSIGWLETLFPDAREFVSPVVHDSIEWCILRIRPLNPILPSYLSSW
jgi:hypothetical protein